MDSLIESQTEKIQLLCNQHRVAFLYLFGSAASGGFTPESDIDFAVVFSQELSPLEHGAAFFGLKEGLEEIFDREIDLLSYRAVKNPIFKEELDNTKVPLYAA